MGGDSSRLTDPRETGIRIAIRLGLITAAILVVLGVLEVVLRLRPTLLGDAYANGALSRYRGGLAGSITAIATSV